MKTTHRNATLEKKPEENNPNVCRIDLAKLAATRRILADPPRAGSLCPVCGQGILDYDGLLVLRCPVCGFSESGCFT